MAIVAACKCGKKFKVKDELAGKAVRCPACSSPMKIPAAKPAKTGGGSSPSVDAADALMRFEEAQKKKQLSAEEEAARREEQNKLIASYDQMTGKTVKPGEKKKKTELEEGPLKKVTIFTRIADFFGAIFGTFAFKYIFITALAAGGVIGSVYLVKFITGYMSDESKPQMPREARMRQLFDTAEKAVMEKDWAAATKALDEIIQSDRKKEQHRDYVRLRKAVETKDPGDGGPPPGG
ncbi:MAG: hypothetical protein HZA51_07665 [Planctomycetes bacterium]|nr:hypothetical protein [Planctomycetota bacterium]